MGQFKNPTIDLATRIGQSIIDTANAGDEYHAYQKLHDHGLHIYDLLEAGYGEDEVEALMRGFRKWVKDNKHYRKIH